MESIDGLHNFSAFLKSSLCAILLTPVNARQILHEELVPSKVASHPDIPPVLILLNLTGRELVTQISERDGSSSLLALPYILPSNLLSVVTLADASTASFGGVIKLRHHSGIGSLILRS